MKKCVTFAQRTEGHAPTRLHEDVKEGYNFFSSWTHGKLSSTTGKGGGDKKQKVCLRASVDYEMFGVVLLLSPEKRVKCSFQKESVVCARHIGIRKGSGDVVLLSPPRESVVQFDLSGKQAREE